MYIENDISYIEILVHLSGTNSFNHNKWLHYLHERISMVGFFVYSTARLGGHEVN